MPSHGRTPKERLSLTIQSPSKKEPAYTPAAEQMHTAALLAWGPDGDLNSVTTDIMSGAGFSSSTRHVNYQLGVICIEYPHPIWAKVPGDSTALLHKDNIQSFMMLLNEVLGLCGVHSL